MADEAGAKKGVIDVGSNSIRLCLYEPVEDEAGYPLRKVFDEKKSAGLAGYVIDGVMSAEGVDVAAKAIGHQLGHARMMGCPDVAVFATAAVRNCANSDQVVAQLQERVGASVEVLSEHDEAQLGFCGVQPGIQLTDGVVVDIGGGSTELSSIRGGHLHSFASVPCGSLALWKAQDLGIFPDKGEYEQCRQYFRRLLRQSGFTADPPEVLYGVGGTVRLACGLYQALDPQGAPDAAVTPRQVQEVVDVCLHDPERFAQLILRLEPSRIHTVVPGLAILLEVFALTGAERITCCSHGVREGYVLARL